jgi:hypothetical protein
LLRLLSMPGAARRAKPRISQRPHQPVIAPMPMGSDP